MVDWNSIDNKINQFTFEGRKCEGKVVSVYDGDTVKIVIPLTDNEPDRLYRWNCRLTGVDTPELRTRCKIEKEHGYKVRDCLREKILNKMVYLRCGEFDKYGRLLVEILCDSCLINDWLIEKDYAFAYDGGTKQSWEDYLSL